MAANASNVIHCVNGSTPTSSEYEGYCEISVKDTKPKVADAGIVLKVIDPVLLYERKQPLDYQDFSVLESDENISENMIYDCGLSNTLRNNICGEADMQLIVPDLLPGRMQHMVGKLYSGVESNENSDEIVDSKIGVFCDTLPNVCEDEMDSQLIVPDLLPETTQVTDKIHSGLKSEENVSEELGSKIAGICELELRDIKPSKVGLDSLRIDPDALRGRMQQMVDKIRTGLTGLCSDPLTDTEPTCFQSPGSSTSTNNKRVFRSRKCSVHQVKHKRKRLYLCPYCQEVFISSFKREVHMMLHVEEES